MSQELPMAHKCNHKRDHVRKIFFLSSDHYPEPIKRDLYNSSNMIPNN